MDEKINPYPFRQQTVDVAIEKIDETFENLLTKAMVFEGLRDNAKEALASAAHWGVRMFETLA